MAEPTGVSHKNSGEGFHPTETIAGAGDGAAELANGRGNSLYRDGRFEAAVEAYSSALEAAAVARGAAIGDGLVVERKSKYYANRSVRVSGSCKALGAGIDNRC